MNRNSCDHRRPAQRRKRHRNLQGQRRLGGKPHGAQLRITESCGDEECGNEIWWNGGSGSGKIGAHGWFGRYLTAYDTGMNGGYGIFTNDETEGSWENIYSSGMDDSGIYLGACRECEARITKATMEDDAVGYSGSNSGGNLIIEHSVFRDNRAGIVPNSENPGDPPPPSNGACDPVQARTRGRTTRGCRSSKALTSSTARSTATTSWKTTTTSPPRQTHPRRWRLGAWAWSSRAYTGTRSKTTRSRATSTTGSSGSSTRTPTPGRRHDLLRVLRRQGRGQHVRRQRRQR